METLTVMDAKSMAAGYNEGMNASDAKYKVYIHQDTFIIEKDFLNKMLKVFKRDKKIGMMGIIGAEKLSKDGVMWHEGRCGNFYRLDEMIKSGYGGIEYFKRGVREVEVIDGFLMATQYDIPWREDLLKGWDFYDVSQCLEFRRAGYKVVVPAQKENWVIHACGAPSFWHYNESRMTVLKEYPEIQEKRANYLRILFFHSNSIVLIGIPYTLSQLGHTVTTAEYKVSLEACGKAENEREEIEEIIEEGNYDLVVTYDFAEEVAAACHSRRIPYYAWCYDDPLIGLYSKEALYDTNYISVFDRIQFERLKDRGFKHLFYLPLAPEVDIFGAVHIGKRDEKKYKKDVTFVGRLYNQHGFEELINKESGEELVKEAEKIIAEFSCNWREKNSIFNQASDDLIDSMISNLPKETWETWDVDKRYYCESLKLVRRCNEVERIAVLQEISREFDLVLYSDESAKGVLKGVTVRPWLEYTTDMPKAFYLSRINLNITSRSIESGIPQRVWDIMAVGGFCLTNYQPELEEYFEIGKELEVYHDLEELKEKIRYYLKHEEQRSRIAINGYKKVRELHSLKRRLKTAIDYIMKEEMRDVLGGENV